MSQVCDSESSLDDHFLALTAGSAGAYEISQVGCSLVLRLNQLRWPDDHV